MPIDTMSFVPPAEIEGKHVISLDDLSDQTGKGDYTYQCSVCRQPVAENLGIRLANVVLQCPHCGAYNGVGESDIPTRGSKSQSRG